ncbi:MAG TPA: hypothetical protein VNR38_00985 [Ureibacillus sp.]|nr:hypothetical protein [Ureibacillus sp.]
MKKETIFRKVLVEDRLPEFCQTKIFIDKLGASAQFSIDSVDVAYCRVNREFVTVEVIKNDYEYWLEEIQLPSEEDIQKQMDSRNNFLMLGFIKGANYILGFINNKK